MKIERKHRIAAIDKIPGDDPKAIAIRQKILDGLADDHPLVQAAAFYETKNKS